MTRRVNESLKHTTFIVVLIIILGSISGMVLADVNDLQPLSDPSLPGSYSYEYLTYGTGLDKHRVEYGKGITLLSGSVDGSALIDWPGSKGKARAKYWGFDQHRLPLNGRVWAPTGPGPFPLVLIVHGNHIASDFSDGGYAYLGELLASHGYITVSVDENFLNGDIWHGGDFHGGENNVRAWLLLKHLELWRRWNNTPEHRFVGRVDLDKVALIGHSRGGEAVATAALFNKLTKNPDNANVSFNFGFGIKSVVAIAPIDGQYRPASKPVVINDINYLTLQGSLDSDVSFFDGLRQYSRINLSTDTYRFKSAVYIQNANHGQFNTTWGRYDIFVPPFPSALVLRTRNMIKDIEQQKIAKAYIAAFLDSTLYGKTQYIPLFRDSKVGEQWLPKTGYYTVFEDSTYRCIANYDEDVDVTTATLDKVRLSGLSLDFWKEGQLTFRNGRWKETNGVTLAWKKQHGIGKYILNFEPEVASKLGISAKSCLAMTVNDGRTTSVPEQSSLDFTVRLTDTQGNEASLPLSTFGSIPKASPIKLSNLPFVEKRYGKALDTPVQRLELPLSKFIDACPNLDVTSLSSVKFVFDITPEGTIVVDDIGYRN